jgi:hypothetical protein
MPPPTTITAPIGFFDMTSTPFLEFVSVSGPFFQEMFLAVSGPTVSASHDRNFEPVARKRVLFVGPDLPLTKHAIHFKGTSKLAIQVTCERFPSLSDYGNSKRYAKDSGWRMKSQKAEISTVR